MFDSNEKATFLRPEEFEVEARSRGRLANVDIRVLDTSHKRMVSPIAMHEAKGDIMLDTLERMKKKGLYALIDQNLGRMPVNIFTEWLPHSTSLNPEWRQGVPSPDQDPEYIRMCVSMGLVGVGNKLPKTPGVNAEKKAEDILEPVEDQMHSDTYDWLKHRIEEGLEDARDEAIEHQRTQVANDLTKKEDIHSPHPFKDSRR